ncbi:MAG: 23S rRNA (guanosine(2251)-2'-O)-methyltransferase RlmB [Candidatus Muiribacteriaceae bacterium]
MTDNRNHIDIYGRNAVEEAVKAGNIRSLVTCDRGLLNRYEGKVGISYMKKKDFTDRFGIRTQGIVGFMKDFQFADLDSFLSDERQHALVMVLDHIEDPHNLGAILRNAEVFGADLVIIPENRSVSVTPVVIKTSAGAVNHIPVCRVKNLSRVLKQLKKNDFWCYGAEADGDVNIYDCDFDRKCVIVLGSEGKGISRNLRDKLDFVVRIPTYGRVNSLNVSSSAAVFLSEYRRKIKKNQVKEV